MQQPPAPQRMVAVSERQALSSLAALTCPMVYAKIHDPRSVQPYARPEEQYSPNSEKGLPLLQPLEVSKLRISIECHISTAFVTIDSTWTLNQYMADKGARLDCLLLVPTPNQATVAGVQIDLGGDRIFGTLVVPQEDTAKYSTQGGPGPDSGNGFSPEVFRLSIPQVKVGSSLDIRVNYFQAMEFDQKTGEYVVRVPLTIDPLLVALNTSLNSLVAVSCAINTGVQLPVEMGHFSHPMKEVASSPGRATFASDSAKAGAWPNTDFVASYKVWAEGILPALIAQGPTPYSYDPRGAFCLSISPPDPKHIQAFQRAVVFVLDSSGSMTGTPMASACAALIEALKMLRPEDSFSIIAFDHEQTAFSSVLLPADAANVKRGVEWVGQIHARGTTDILTPLMQAVGLLSAVQGVVPYVFLITDGAVDNERIICLEVERAVQTAGPRAPRISTFGIGQYCNFFFLKMLASIGRGLNDVAFTERRIKSQMERMLVAASTPLLTNISLQIDLPHGCELYPFPIPDLFCGNPLVISGKFDGRFPDKIRVVGTLPDQSLWSVEVVTQSAPDIPIGTVFAKQQLDLLTARAWLYEDTRVKEQAVQLSVATGLPCEYTRMVAFETTKPQYAEAVQQAQQGKKVKLAKYAIGGVAGIAVVAGLAIGFGSVAATVANVGLGGFDLGLGLDGIGDADCCGGCGECGDCGDCGECCNCEDCDIGDCLETVLGCIGDAL